MDDLDLNNTLERRAASALRRAFLLADKGYVDADGPLTSTIIDGVFDLEWIARRVLTELAATTETAEPKPRR